MNKITKPRLDDFYSIVKDTNELIYLMSKFNSRNTEELDTITYLFNSIRDTLDKTETQFYEYFNNLKKPKL